eukprot:12059360-Alexandrium_andersonii.AAC.1
MVALAVSRRSAASAIATLIGASSAGHIWCLSRIRRTRAMNCGGIDPTNPDVKITSLTLR